MRTIEDVAIQILCRLFNLEEEELRLALYLTEYYKIFDVRKRNGKIRTIYEPREPLKKVQREIKRSWDRGKKAREGIFGLTKGLSSLTSSYVNNALVHREGKWIFQFDLKDAFPSTNLQVLRQLILESILRSRKWRKITREEGGKGKEKEIAEEFANLIIKLTTYRGILPQGTPTAPILFYANLALEGRLFSELLSLFSNASGQKFKITVYVDNFIISSNKPIPQEKREGALRLVEKFGFTVNPQKTRHQGIAHIAPMVTGLRIVNQRPVLSKATVRRIRGLIHRATFNPLLRPRVEGLIGSLKAIYEYWGSFPTQVRKPYERYCAKKCEERFGG